MDSALVSLARRQAGVWSHRQALAHGETARSIRRHLVAGRWVEVRRGGYVSGSTPHSYLAEVWAVALAVGGTYALTGWTAAYVRRWPDVTEPDHVDVVVPRSRRTPPIPGARLRKVDDFPPSVAVVGGLRVLRSVDCLADLAADLDDRAYVALGQVLAQRGLVDLDALAAYRGRGVAGSARIGLLVATCSDRHESLAARRLWRAARQRGLSLRAGVELHDRTGRLVALLDMADEEARVAVEFDGWASHGRRDQFAKDRQRRRRLYAEYGYVVVEITYDDLLWRLDAALDEVAAVVARRLTELRPA